MHGGIMRPGAASIVIGAALLLGALPTATAFSSATEPTPESTQEAVPESTFHIFGLVESPGRYDWSTGMTVGRAVAAAGGYADGGSPDELQIQRVVEGRLVSRAVTEDDAVQPDDVIMVRGKAVERPDDGIGIEAGAFNCRGAIRRGAQPAALSARRPDRRRTRTHRRRRVPSDRRSGASARSCG